MSHNCKRPPLLLCSAEESDAALDLSLPFFSSPSISPLLRNLQSALAPLSLSPPRPLLLRRIVSGPSPRSTPSSERRIPLLTMSKDSYAKQNELGPNYLGYYKHLFFELFSQNEDIELPLSGSNSEPSAGYSDDVRRIHNQDKGWKGKSCSTSGSFFAGGIGEELSEFKKEKLKSIIHESAVCFNQEADEVFGQILSAFQAESDRRKKELLPGCASASDEDMSEPNCGRKRKASFSPISDSYLSYTDILNSQSIRQVYNDTQAVQGNDEICQEALEKANKISAKLCKMEQDLEEFLDVVVSKCREMTCGEKRQLGKQIQKLPEKAFDRVVEIVQQTNLSASHLSDNIFINLEEQVKI
ncbi:uncharacterized protein LOC103719834 isoform X2 [Phoenix dactylifera]|uniref:Uncharacterized protein LOC103719834 isoform X2 n=1 Tax=Phoenix dactylifera TaxID=42345 RepID=A0A8B9ATY6_PHODC|nr:uncharacterized protein LOC103719834 isoform X2 [Phoenix dactylifera]